MQGEGASYIDQLYIRVLVRDRAHHVEAKQQAQSQEVAMEIEMKQKKKKDRFEVPLALPL
jgi:hypothetical protein